MQMFCTENMMSSSFSMRVLRPCTAGRPHTADPFFSRISFAVAAAAAFVCRFFFASNSKFTMKGTKSKMHNFIHSFVYQRKVFQTCTPLLKLNNYLKTRNSLRFHHTPQQQQQQQQQQHPNQKRINLQELTVIWLFSMLFGKLLWSCRQCVVIHALSLSLYFLSLPPHLIDFPLLAHSSCEE